MIDAVSLILRRTPGLLRDFNVLLVGSDRRIQCADHLDEVNLITVITSNGACIRAIPGVQNMPETPPNFATDTEDLRRKILLSDNSWKDLLTLKSEWASCTQELIQTVCQNERHDIPTSHSCLRLSNWIWEDALILMSETTSEDWYVVCEE